MAQIKIEKLVNPNFISAFSKLCRTVIPADQLSLARSLGVIEKEQAAYKVAVSNIQSKYAIQSEHGLMVTPDKLPAFSAELDALNGGDAEIPLPQINLPQTIKTEKNEPFTAMDLYMLDGIVSWK